VGAPTTDLRTGVLFEETDDAETLDRIDVEETVLLAAVGVRLVRSTGDREGRLFLAVEVVVEGTRGLVGVLVPEAEVEVVEVLILTVETVDAVDTLLLRGREGVTSDFAVSKWVEPSLVLVDMDDPGLVDAVEEGLDNPDGGRRVEGPAIFLRSVGAIDLVDLTEAATERGLGVEW